MRPFSFCFARISICLRRSSTGSVAPLPPRAAGGQPKTTSYSPRCPPSGGAGRVFRHTTNPPVATGYAAAGLPLNKALVSEIVLSLGCIPLARYGTPGTSEQAQTLEPNVPNYDAILMSNHGVVTYGDTLEHAFMKMETVEHFAQIALVTHLLGRQQPLKQVEIEKLLTSRPKYFGAKIEAAMPLPRMPQKVG